MAEAWDKWEQYVFVPIPICLGIFATAFFINSAYAILLVFLVYLILVYDIYIASNLKSMLIVFSPKLIMKFSAKGILLSFSITAAVLVLISSGKQPELNVGKKMGDLVDEHIIPQINQEIENRVESVKEDPMEVINRANLGDEQKGLLEKTGVLDNLANIKAPELSLAETITQEVNKLIEPYKRFVNPIISIMAFGIVQFLGTISFIIYMLSIDILFWLAKKTGFIKIEKVPTEKEILHF